MNFDMLNLQKALMAMKATPKTPKTPQPSEGFGFVFEKPTTPTPIPKVKPAV